MEDIVNNRAFRIRVHDKEGYIIYKNGFYLFQPELLWDKNLPLSMRIADFPVKRDYYEPRVIEKEVIVETIFFPTIQRKYNTYNPSFYNDVYISIWHPPKIA